MNGDQMEALVANPTPHKLQISNWTWFSSILTARALAPVELAIAHWKGFIGSRQSWRRLAHLLDLLPQANTPMPLPRPSASLAVESVSAAPPSTQKLVVQDVSFALKAGSGLGVIGPSASGKSSLARALVGVWSTLRGKVRLDGAALTQWDLEQLGRHIGYLPQDVELFAGTVAQNIARFDPDADADRIIAAAKAAGVHDLILRLPEGYETQIGRAGRRSLPANASAWRWPAPSTATRFWWCWMSPTPISMLRANRP
jgi:ABC-type protease/lipase transport system fused ATPase/permease subunit